MANRPARRIGALACRLLAAALLLVSAGSATAQSLDQPMTQRQIYCRQLEEELARDWQLASQGREQLPQIEAEMRKVDRIYQQSQARAEQLDCYEYFLFTKNLRNTPQCRKLARQIDDARRRLGALEQQREVASSTHNQRNKQDAMLTELARNGCGPQYEQEANRRANRSFSFWEDGEDVDPGLAPLGEQQILPYATYRTLCVRLCDGYFFPVSYATLPSQFQHDAAQCSAQCAAPAELYVYQNPGSDVEAATSLGGEPYTKLKTAWNYRKSLVKGCSCKVAEYSPNDIEGKGEETGSITPADGTKNAAGTVEEQPLDPVPSVDQIGALIDNDGTGAGSGDAGTPAPETTQQ